MSIGVPPGRETKVVRVIARLNVGGPARHVVLLNDGLQARGYDTLLVYGSVAPGEASLEHLADTRRLRKRKILQLGRRLNPISDLWAFAQLVQLMYRERPDIVHTHTAKAGTLGRLAALAFNATRARRRRCLVIHTFHGHVLSGYFSPSANMLVRLAERGLALLTDRIVTISPAQRRDIVGRFKIGIAERTVIIPLGLDIGALLRLEQGAPTLRHELQVDEDAIVIGYIGRFVPIKDLATLIRAFAAALDRCPALTLLLVGDGPLRRTLEALVDDLRIASCVRFTGWIEDLAAVYAAVDVCAISSLNEGTPVAIIEAMAAAKAVVATAVGGVPDMIEDGITGLLVPAANVDALADAIVRLAMSPTDRARLGGAGRRAAAVRFSYQRLVDDMDRLYRQALDAKRGGG